MLEVRPGITDLASIRYRNENELLEKTENPDKYYVEVIMRDKLRINLEYVKNHSFWYDIKLIFLTFWEICDEIEYETKSIALRYLEVYMLYFRTVMVYKKEYK